MEIASWFADALGRWFEAEGRDLPWRHNPSPYRVWVSEVMLQQTQVVTVIPYFERWMLRFGDVAALANADDEAVMALWAGLGYYRRARYLLEGARYVVNQLGGIFPSAVAELRKIPGVGEYTAGAIASMAWGAQVPAVDGNAERVLSRFFGIRGDLSRGEPRHMLMSWANAIAEKGQAGRTNQAIMDLGASMCGRNAECEACPLHGHCAARRLGLTSCIPQKKQRPEKCFMLCAALAIKDCRGRILLARRPRGALLGGLWTFPMIPLAKVSDGDALRAALVEARMPRPGAWRDFFVHLGVEPSIDAYQTTQGWVRHIFTHIDMRVTIDLAHWRGAFPSIPPSETYDAFEAVENLETASLPFSMLMQKLIAQRGRG
ncbi:MAG: A/G-specific adenine glycosylase [Proteobacteria bacterium]|nr:A/G-specific adenine glycosylase [Pseudomonadota bacterium]